MKRNLLGAVSVCIAIFAVNGCTWTTPLIHDSSLKAQTQTLLDQKLGEKIKTRFTEENDKAVILQKADVSRFIDNHKSIRKFLISENVNSKFSNCSDSGTPGIYRVINRNFADLASDVGIQPKVNFDCEKDSPEVHPGILDSGGKLTSQSANLYNLTTNDVKKLASAARAEFHQETETIRVIAQLKTYCLAMEDHINNNFPDVEDETKRGWKDRLVEICDLKNETTNSFGEPNKETELNSDPLGKIILSLKNNYIETFKVRKEITDDFVAIIGKLPKNSKIRTNLQFLWREEARLALDEAEAKKLTARLKKLTELKDARFSQCKELAELSGKTDKETEASEPAQKADSTDKKDYQEFFGHVCKDLTRLILIAQGQGGLDSLKGGPIFQILVALGAQSDGLKTLILKRSSESSGEKSDGADQNSGNAADGKSQPVNKDQKFEALSAIASALWGAGLTSLELEEAAAQEGALAAARLQERQANIAVQAVKARVNQLQIATNAMLREIQLLSRAVVTTDALSPGCRNGKISTALSNNDCKDGVGNILANLGLSWAYGKTPRDIAMIRMEQSERDRIRGQLGAKAQIEAETVDSIGKVLDQYASAGLTVDEITQGLIALGLPIVLPATN